MKIEYNKHRVEYLLSLFKMTVGELLSSINKGLKTPITWEDIDSDEIELNYLKRIDKVFNKGLLYYYDPTVPVKDKKVSVFFRKESFTSELNIGARKRVREFEDIKTQISAISIMSHFDMKRVLRTYSLDENPREVAFALRGSLLPEFTSSKRDYLKSFINKLGKNNILVLEFVDTFNKKEKANIDGFYIGPNAIVLKRNQDALSREIFTLCHELGHYLLDKEDVDELDFAKVTDQSPEISEVEKWCNSFAFFLLLGQENARKLESIALYDYRVDYGHDLVASISKETNLSRLAIFTNLFLQHRMTYADYSNVRDNLHEQYLTRKEKERQEKENRIAAGEKISGRNPKPIQSNLIYDIYNYALNKGVVTEYEYCSALNIKPNDISRVFYEGSH
ncbi:MAG: ImmA/IrrE family metallo-endopeptidase [Bacteroidaceae bacterium]|nr:ImmA/IrrE family metallo-endopeptidase [Bacteroidaceae bacterium]